MPDHILKHLHPYTHNKETKRIGISENPEFDRLTVHLRKWLYNFFPVTADNEGLRRWEDFLDLGHGAPGESLEERRRAVLLKLNERLPYTLPRLYQMLASLCGWEGFTFSLEGPQLSEVHIKIEWETDVLMSTVMEMLERVLPLNLHFDCLWHYKCEPAVIDFGEYTFITEILETKKPTDHLRATVVTGQIYFDTDVITTPIPDSVRDFYRRPLYRTAKTYEATGAQVTEIFTTPLLDEELETG